VNPPGLEQVAQAQGLVKAGPVELVAAVFLLAFVWMLFMYLRAKDRHLANVAELDKDHRLELKEAEKANAIALAELNKERLEQAIRIETTLAKFLMYVDKVQVSRRRPAAKEGGDGGNPGP
jgi:hypothetical protein